MKKPQRIGTSKNPIKPNVEHGSLSGIDNERGLLHRFILPNASLKPKGNPDAYFDFKYADEADFLCSFIANLTSNPNLTKTEFKIGISLYDLLQNNDGKVFITTSRNIDPYRTIGEDEELFIGKELDLLASDIEDQPLYQLLKDKYGINVNTDVMNKVIRRLHSFHYITVTNITHNNLYKDNTINPENKKRRAYLKHIKLYEGMIKRTLVGKWLSKGI